MKTLFLLIIAFAFVPATARAQGGAGKVASELAEYAMKHFAREAAEEGVERLSGRIAAAAAKYGDDAVKAAVQKIGPKAIALADDAGEHGAQALRLITRHGDDAAWLASRPASMKLIAEYGDDAAEILIKHRAIVEPLAETLGAPAMEALESLGPQAGRRLAMLADSGELAGLGHTQELLSVIGRYGDRAMEFIWQNKGSLVIGTGLVAFLNNPEPFLERTATVAESATQRVAAPLATAAGDMARDAASVSIRVVAGLIAACAVLALAWSVISGQVRSLFNTGPDS